MYRISMVAGLVGSILFGVVRAEAPKEKSETIPLDQIWGYGLSGTRKLEELGKDRKDKTGAALVSLMSEASVTRADPASRSRARVCPHFKPRTVFSLTKRRRRTYFCRARKSTWYFSRSQFLEIVFGRLPVGNYSVEMRQLPREKKYIDAGAKPLDEEWSLSLLCKPFSFTVAKDGE